MKLLNIKETLILTLSTILMVSSVLAESKISKSKEDPFGKYINMPPKDDGVIMSRKNWEAMQKRYDHPEVEPLRRVYSAPATRDDLVTEGFEVSVPPDGWTLVDHEGGGLNWDQSTSYYFEGAASAYCTDHNGSQKTELISPSFDLTGFSSASLTYQSKESFASYW